MTPSVEHRQVDLAERLHQAEAGFLVDAERVALPTTRPSPRCSQTVSASVIR